MRTVTRNFLLGVALVVVLLLALGAVPSYLKSGDPYYLTATPENGSFDVENGTAVDAGALSEQRYPYTSAALDDATATAAGQSEPYWRGPLGVKGAFTHSPFDERDALSQQYPGATASDGTVVRHEETFYRLTVTQHV